MGHHRGSSSLTVVKSLGKGGFGEVLLVRNRWGKKYAAKTFKSRSAFKKEVENYKRVPSGTKGTPKYYGTTLMNINGGTKKVMLIEFIKGVPLSKFVKFHVLSHRQKRQIMLALAKILRKFHRHHFSHNDLNPGNVFIASSGKVKVIDLGLCTQGHSQKVRYGEKFGHSTVLGYHKKYSAPEVKKFLLAHRNSDIYSFGMLLVYLEYENHGMIRSCLHPNPDSRPPWEWIIDNL